MPGFGPTAFVCALLASAAPAFADVVARPTPVAGSVIARKSGEEVRFIDVSSWRAVDVHQDLLAGDVLRTNATGHLAVLFSDRTQVRLGRNTTLLVKEINATDSTLGLEAGTIWARAERGGEGVTIDTPAAAAAIRGTDWTMTVSGDKTSLTVLEGKVQLSNEFGSVDVAAGEGAVATIGSAPSKIVIVDSDDREQMLFYLSLRSSYGWMPASPLSNPDMRKERERISAIPEQARGGEDWLTLAEVRISYDGKSSALEAAGHARAFRLTAAQKARLDLIDGLAAGQEHRFADAAALFERAAPHLDKPRRAMALYGGYYARSLANPDHVESAPKVSGGGPNAALAAAWTAGFLEDLPTAIEMIKQAEKQYPDDPSLPAYRALLALLIDARAQTKKAVDRALELDPDNPIALEARANYRAGIQSDLKGALADMERAVKIAPGSTRVWNGMGNVQSERGADREAEAAYKRSIELDPDDPVAYANLAIFYLDQDRPKAAKALIDKALEADPSFDIALVARGRYYLQTGEIDKALQDLLAGSTANPAYAQALLLLAAAYYENGDRAPSRQAVDNAERLDANDPVTSSFVTAVAIDDYDSDLAIRSAQEALRRSRARGGDYSSLSASLDEGSTLNDAYRLQGLDAWGRYYGDAAFDPFGAAGYIDQAIAGSANSFINSLAFGGIPVEPSQNSSAFSSYFQGLLLDPTLISGRSTRATILRSPFVEASLGGGFVSSDDDTSPSGEVEIQGFQTNPVPWSFYGKFDTTGTEDFRIHEVATPGLAGQVDIDQKVSTGIGYVTVKPTPYDRVVAFANVQNDQPNLQQSFLIFPGFFPTYPDGGTRPIDLQDVDNKIGNFGLAWSHTIGYHNIVSAAAFATGFKGTSSEDQEVNFNTNDNPIEGAYFDDAEVKQTSYLAAVNHAYGIGDLTLRYGIEGGTINTDVSAQRITYIPIFNYYDLSKSTSNTDTALGRAYLDALYDFTPDLKAEAGLFGTYLSGGSNDVTRADPRVGVAWAPWEGQWLRVGYLSETLAANTSTLAPIGVVGLQSNQLPLDVGGKSDTFAARWDAEWTDNIFTAVDYQHQEVSDLSITVPGDLFPLDEASGFEKGRLDRISATANVYFGYGLGGFATAVYADSENETPGPYFGNDLPFVPDISGRIGLTYVNPVNVKVTLAATYVGERTGDRNGAELDDYWTADAFLTWEPFDKRFELELAGYNLFDEDFDVANDPVAGFAIPGWGRTFTGSLKVRF